MQITGMLYGSKLLRHVGFPTAEDAMTVRGGVMRADMTMDDIVHRDIAVPEPAFAVGLLAGAAALAARARGRRER